MESTTLSQSKIKCVVWDLDNTVWDGILLENSNVKLRTGIKKIIKELDKRGVLQSISSKNDRSAAEEKLKEFGIYNFFLYPQINWEPKSASVKTIASLLNIGIDTFAFVDDQEFERDEVKYTHPGTLCIDANKLDLILDMPEMKPAFITDDSAKRRVMYQSDILRGQIEEKYEGTKQEFLETLGLNMTIKRAKEDDLKRAEELTIRTHQLNSTGYTYSYEELKHFMRSPDHILLIAGLEDKYGTYGKIGLSLVERTPESYVIKLLLMSCRVMSRGVGNIMLSYIMEIAKKSEKKLIAEFKQTDRNRMMLVTYKFAGFQESYNTDGIMTLVNNCRQSIEYPSYVKLLIE
jgi:FkbH-like protein